ncbi:MAG: hypothetical protein BM564_06620 [Bacteroidetes bacterium MedPE-SWsnd-G2]|nr:MAG: hypothetical protein BM564_06620 [Bacteroidetes bacterium MedPE-SWsnd-G2]
MKSLTTFSELIACSEKEQLYDKLVLQLNKDFRFANIDFEVSTQISPQELKQDLLEVIYGLIQTKFSEYLNLLYIIDVSEKQIKALNGDDTLVLAEQVSFLILKREWQKVWYRAKY